MSHGDRVQHLPTTNQSYIISVFPCFSDFHFRRKDELQQAFLEAVDFYVKKIYFLRRGVEVNTKGPPSWAKSWSWIVASRRPKQKETGSFMLHYFILFL